MKLTKEQSPDTELVQVVDVELNEEQLEVAVAAGGGILGAVIGGAIGAIAGPGGAIIGAVAGHAIEEALH